MTLKDRQYYSKGIQLPLHSTPHFSLILNLLTLLLLFDKILMIAQESYTFQVCHFFIEETFGLN